MQLPWRHNFGRIGQCGSDATHELQSAISPTTAITFGGADQGLTCALPIPASATDLALTITWPESPPPGVYVRLTSRQFDSAGNAIRTFLTVFEQRAGNRSVPGLVHLQPGAAKIELTLENAFHPSVVELADIDCRFLSAAGQHCPAGAVGLIAADHAQLPELLADLMRNLEHYRATAADFGKQFKQEHQTARTIERLKLNQGLVPQVVAGSDRPLRAA